jgi:hypothetical protein
MNFFAPYSRYFKMESALRRIKVPARTSVLPDIQLTGSEVIGWRPKRRPAIRGTKYYFRLSGGIR